MASHPRAPRSRGDRRGRQLRPSVLPLEDRVVPVLTFPGIGGITFDATGDVFVSYNNTTRSSGQQQSVAEVDVIQTGDNVSQQLINATVFTTSGGSAFPGSLATVGPSDSLPSITGESDDSAPILELQPNGQLFVFNPQTGNGSQYDNLANYSPTASSVYNAQTGMQANLTGQISLASATFGDFGVYQNSIVVAGESSNWDFVMRVTYGSSGGVATILAASPITLGHSTTPEGVAVDSLGTVLTTLPYVAPGSNTATDVPVGFSLTYDSGGTPKPVVPALGLTSVPDIAAGAIAVDSQNNFIIAATNSSLYDGGPGIVHINSALTAFLADPTQYSEEMPAAIACATVSGTSELVFTDANTNQFGDPTADTFTFAGELPLFSGQVNAAQLRQAYGINQISFKGPGGTTVTGDGTGQTIAIVEEGVDPTLAADLATFDQFYGIPAPPNFQIIDQNGVTTLNDTIVGEASLDVEWAHAVAPGASIIVYNAAYNPNPNDGTVDVENLFAAMQQASKLPGVSVVTLSYGIPESDLTGSGLSETSFDSDFTTPGVTFLAAAGDTGIYGGGGNQPVADYPAASPNVVSVGGTSVVFDAAGDYPGTGPSGEIAWGEETDDGFEGGGGGLSDVEPEPSWQEGVVPTSMDPTDTRALPDVSMDSGAAQEYDVFTSTLGGSSDSALAVGWLGDAGTSAASPIWAGLIAIADQGRALSGGTSLTGNTQTLPALYSLPSTDFHDIVNGNNGDPAEPGYDLASGLGTPIANLLVPALASYDLVSKSTTSIAVQASPQSPVFGQPITLTATVTAGTGVPTGSVTFEQGSTVLGTANLDDGVATFITTPKAAGNFAITIAYGGDTNDKATSTTFSVTVSQAAATLSLGSLNATYDSLPHTASVTTNPAGLSGVTVTYSQNGAAVTNPIQTGDYAVTATLSNPNYTASPATGTLIITQAAATLSLSNLNLAYDGSPQNAVATTNPAGLSGVTISYAQNGVPVANPTQEGDYSVTATLSNPNYTAPEVTGTLVISQANTTLIFSGLNDTYDGSPQFAQVTTGAGTLSGITVTYSQNGVPVADPTRAGNYDVTATLSNPTYTALAATATLVIGQATPALTWSAPANITVGTALSSTQLDATATSSGVPLAGTFTYTPAAGAMLSAGNSQSLAVSFTPADTTDYKSAMASVPINVLPQAPPEHVTIIGEQPVFTRKLNKKGKPIGKAVLTGFTLEFNTPLLASAVSNPGNYEVDTVTIKKVKKSLDRLVHPIKGFTVTETPATNSVTIKLAGTQSFPTGGQITVLPGVTDNFNAVLSGPTVFKITPGGKKVEPT